MWDVPTVNSGEQITPGAAGEFLWLIPSVVAMWGTGLHGNQINCACHTGFSGHVLMGGEAVRFHSPSNYRELGHPILTFLKPGLISYGSGGGPPPEWFSGRMSANGTVHLIGQSRI